MKRFEAFLKTPIKGFVFALILILAGSFGANIFNTSFYKVDVNRISFETAQGTLSGLLYMPEGASGEDPRPTIITTHGYLNSAEMQDAPAIEMSKRGVVVLALDMYDHGHSSTEIDTDTASAFFSFWPTSLHDAVQYMYDQPYVKKDEAGNGIIAVSGHSMGGFSTTMAMVMDEQQYAQSGIRKIKAGLTVGADFLWTSYLEVTEEVANNAMGPRVSGKIAGHFDEFFFDMAAAVESRSVTYKDYLKQPEGQAFLGNPENPVEGEFYTLENGGLRVIYTPNQTHPWNHFSKVTTADEIKFYAKAFENNLSSTQIYLNEENQTWFLKELFELIAMVGFFMMFVPLATLFAGKIAFFRSKEKSIEGETSVLPSTLSISQKIGFALIVLISAGFPAYFYPAFMGKIPADLLKLQRGAELFAIVGVILLIVSMVSKTYRSRTNKVMAILMVVISLIGRILMSHSGSFFVTGAFFNAPTVNQFVYWAVSASGFAALLTTVLYFVTTRGKKALQLSEYGLTKSVMDIVRGLCLAILLVVSGVVVIFVVDAVFTTDFRFWTFAVKTFNAKQLFAAIRYMPFFLVFYLVNGIAIHKTTHDKKKSILWSLIMNIGGLLAFLILQYGVLFATGTGILPGQSLTSIILIGMVPVLLVATIFSRKLTKLTGNIYAGTFLNTILMTIITVANTVVYSHLV